MSECAAVKKAGWVPRTQTWTAPDGKPARHCAVWWKPARPGKGSDFRDDGDVEWYERMLPNDLLQSDVRLVAGNPLAPPRRQARHLYQSAQRDLERQPDDLDARFRRAEAAFWLGQDEQALGRSRGGFGTKIHAAVNGLGLPVKLVLTPGQAADVTQAKTLIAGVPSEVVIGDRGHDSQAVVQAI